MYTQTPICKSTASCVTESLRSNQHWNSPVSYSGKINPHGNVTKILPRTIYEECPLTNTINAHHHHLVSQTYFKSSQSQFSCVLELMGWLWCHPAARRLSHEGARADTLPGDCGDLADPEPDREGHSPNCKCMVILQMYHCSHCTGCTWVNRYPAQCPLKEHRVSACPAPPQELDPSPKAVASRGDACKWAWVNSWAGASPLPEWGA